MKKITDIFRRSVLSPSSSSSSSPPRRDSGVPPCGLDSYIIRLNDLDKIHKAAALGDVKKVQELLLQEKAGVDDLDKKHRTPLHLACSNGYPDVVSLLIERKCKLNLLDDEDQTPLMNAVQYQREECTTILLEHGADACAMNTYQSTALHYAACLPNIKIASKLLRYNILMEAKNKDGCTPLLLAVMKNNRDMVDLFLRNGANVNTSDVHDRTPLMIAARSNQMHVVSLLLRYNIDFSHKDAYGHTALKHAFYCSPLMHHLVLRGYNNQKALYEALSPQICSSERASDPEFTLGRPDKDQEDSIEELDLDGEDVIDVTKNQPGSKEFETFPFEEDEAFGFGSDSETGFSIVIPGEKPIPRKQFEAQIPIVKEQDEEDETETKLQSINENILYEGAGDNYSCEVLMVKTEDIKIDITSDCDDEECTGFPGKPYTEGEETSYLLGWLVPVCIVTEHTEESSSDSDDDRGIWWRNPTINTEEESEISYQERRTNYEFRKCVVADRTTRSCTIFSCVTLRKSWKTQK
ncbi:uncharacterized protein [Notamacropus eugenii]|uniref:uncharacterized protein isoform X2 n=1 Tax=Notamacropus eugenii TaxID=9315 RepID=UPI003B67DA88